MTLLVAASRLFGVKHFAGQVFYEAQDLVVQGIDPQFGISKVDTKF